MSEEKNFNTNENEDRNEKYSLNDDRRIKTLSPGQLVMKRFLRNKVAVAGMIILVIMFLFSFVGGWLSPYGQDQVFYRNDFMSKDYAAVTENTGYRYSASNPEVFTSVAQAQAMLAITRGESSITYNGVTYELHEEGIDFYSVYVNGEEVGMCYIDIVNANDGSTVDYDFQFAALKALVAASTALAACLAVFSSSFSLARSCAEPLASAAFRAAATAVCALSAAAWAASWACMAVSKAGSTSGVAVTLIS